MAQWLRIHLPMQGTRVRALVQEDPIPHAAEQLSPCATTTEPACHTTEAHAPRAYAPQQETRAPQRRVAPTRRN